MRYEVCDMDIDITWPYQKNIYPLWEHSITKLLSVDIHVHLMNFSPGSQKSYQRINVVGTNVYNKLCSNPYISNMYIAMILTKCN